jgi:hypothetical protein
MLVIRSACFSKEKMMKKTFGTSLVRAAIGGVALGLTLVVGVGDAAYAEEQPGQQSSLAAVTDAAPSAGPSAEQSVPTARPMIQSTYTAPSMGGSYVPSNHRGDHGGGNPN